MNQLKNNNIELEYHNYINQNFKSQVKPVNINQGIKRKKEEKQEESKNKKDNAKG
jgi:hypothetical protein